MIDVLSFHKSRLIECKDFSLKYKNGTGAVIQNLSFELIQGERYFLKGDNGCGKSSLIKAILELNKFGHFDNVNFEVKGQLNVANNLVISYVSQDTSCLRGV